MKITCISSSNIKRSRESSTSTKVCDLISKMINSYFRYQNRWIVVRHKERSTWEIPGGHIEKGEIPDAAAARELNEETGAVKFKVTPICIYSVDEGSRKRYGHLYIADVQMLGDLPESEIAEIRLVDEVPENLTYPSIQPILFKKVVKYLCEKSDDNSL